MKRTALSWHLWLQVMNKRFHNLNIPGSIERRGTFGSRLLCMWILQWYDNCTIQITMAKTLSASCSKFFFFRTMFSLCLVLETQLLASYLPRVPSSPSSCVHKSHCYLRWTLSSLLLCTLTSKLSPPSKKGGMLPTPKKEKKMSCPMRMTPLHPTPITTPLSSRCLLCPVFTSILANP